MAGMEGGGREEGGREGGRREGGRERGREGEREGGRERGREGGCDRGGTCTIQARGEEEGMVINWTCSAVEYHNNLI